MEEKWPKSPKKLLEARYQAFVDGNIDYIMNSHHPETRESLDRAAVTNWSKDSNWMGFKIEDERKDGKTVFITFSVRYEKNMETTDHREIAEFRKEDGKWYYYDSEFPTPETLRREEPKVGRNDPCHCGSGKKFKKCHGAAGQAA
jgi:SEC-C motif-containing protein